jgi:microcystin-dependent protein
METNGDLIMAVNYNSLKTLRGTSIGTIVPWCGDIAAIPKGWIACDGETLSVTNFPMLYEIIGNRYGGTLNVSFNTPNFSNKGVVDYHTSHSTISGIGMPDVFKNLINDTNDVANASVSTPSSNIDLRVDQVGYNNIAAAITTQSLVDPSFSDAVYIAGRLLGDDHIASHSHPTDFETVGQPSSWVEACQTNNGSNCFSAFECRDDCNNNNFYPTEANNPYGQSLFKGFPEGGLAIYQAVSGAGTANVDFARQNSYGGSGIRNYILPSDDPASSNTGLFGYNTSLDQNAVNFVSNNHNVHDHLSMSYDITKGSMSIPANYNINNIGTSNVTPQNEPLRDIGRIQIEVDTAVCQVKYIIRAY